MPLGPGFTVENRARVALYDLPTRTPPGASPPPSSTAFAPTRPDGEKSQCTYRCVVLPDFKEVSRQTGDFIVSMHLQVRGAP